MNIFHKMKLKILIQEDLPFIKSENKSEKKLNLNYLNLDLLKNQQKKKEKILKKMKLMIQNF